MNEDNVFKVYVGNLIPGPGLPTVIVAADTSVKPIVYGEWYVFLDGDRPYYNGQIVSCDTTKVPKEVAYIDLIYMLEDALFQAKQSLSTYLFNNYQKKNPNVYGPFHYSFEESGKGALLRLCIRGKFKSELNRIKEQTKSESLREFLGYCLSAPQISFHSEKA